MVNTKDQSNVIVYGILFVNSVYSANYMDGSLLHCMQHVLTVLTYSRSCKTCLFHIKFFFGKFFLKFPIIYLTVDLKLICIFGLSDLVYTLIFANMYLG